MGRSVRESTFTSPADAEPRAVVAPAPRLWSISDVAEYLGVPVGTIYQWRVRDEGPPAMRMGKHLRFDPESVARWAHGLEEDGDGRRHP